MHISTLGVRRLLALVTVGVLIPLGLQSPAHAVVPMPFNLSPSGSVSSNTPTLSWSKVSGGVRYEVQVDNTDDFSSPLFTSSTTNNRSVPDKVLPAGELFWHVRAINASNVQSEWALETINVAATEAPTPVSPANGDVLSQPNEPPLLVWDGTQGAVKYTVQIDETDDFISPLVSVDTQTTSLVAPNPLSAGPYFWRVKASKATGVDSAYSSPANFSVSALDTVTVVSPNNNPDNAVEDVVLDWLPVPGASYYQLQVATDTDFNTIVDNKALTSSKILGTQYSPATTYDNNQYYWRVRAVDVAGNPTAWSPIQAQFNRVWPDRPTALHPVGDGSPMTHMTNPAYFQWTPVQHATQYELQLGTDENFSPGTTENCQTAGTTYTPGLYGINHTTGSVSRRSHENCQLVPGQIYYWRVRPLDRPFNSPGVEGLYSEAQTFIYDDSAFGSFSPTGGQTVGIPTLSWNPIQGVEKYEIDIQNGLGQNVKSNVTTYSTSYTPVGIDALDPAKGPYHWWVHAINADGTPGSLVYENTFNVSGNIPTTGAPALTPLSGITTDPATVRAPALRWEPKAGAVSYRVFAGPHGTGTLYIPVSGDALEKELPYPAVTDTWTWFLSPGQYDWRVQAYDADGGVIGVGPIATFTVGQLAPVQGRQIALDGLALDADNGCNYAVGGVPDKCNDVPATPVFDWAPVEGAGSYILYVSEDSSFTNLVEPLTSVAATTSTRWAPTMSSLRSALPDSQAGGAYWWFVRPCKTTKICGPSPVSAAGMATNKFSKRSLGVSLSSPGNGATVSTTDVVLDWADYFDTNQGTTWVVTGEHSPQAAMTYRVQVDNDATFASPIETVDVDQSTYTSAAKLYPEGVLYWHVQAIDAEGNTLPWSPSRTFTKSTPAIGLLAPIGGAHVSGTTAFRWAPQASVSSYQLEVYKDGDTAASPTNKLFGSTVSTKQSAYVYAKPIPVSPQPYVWRVRRIDASSNAGPWSSWGQFYSGGSAPVLLSPAAGALQAANGPLFTWTEVTGATTYVLETRSTTSTAKLSGTPKTTPATAWATTSAVGDGIWEWRVTAKDSGGAVLGTSAGWRRFTVDAKVPSVISKSPTTTAYRTANFRAKFSEPVKGVSSSTMRIYRYGYSTPLLAKVTLSADKLTATLNPSANLKIGKYYVIKLSSGITDLAGNKLVATSWKVKAK